MNSMVYFDHQFILQQQLLLQQLLYFNQMMVMKAQANQAIISKPIVQTPDCPTQEIQTIRNDDTNEEVSSFQLPKSVKVHKKIRKINETKQSHSRGSQENSTKKIFLSMKDIKNVQYKQYKSVPIPDQQCKTSDQEKI